MNSRCVRCGSCKALCPTYIEDTTEGMSARGRLALLDKFAGGEIAPSKTLDYRIFSCLLCGACNRLCPLGINITDEIYEYRKNFVKFDNRRKIIGSGIRLAVKNASACFRMLKFIETIGEALPLHRLKYFNALKELGISPLGSPLKDGMSLFRARKPVGRIAVFAGCTVNYLYPDTGRSLIRCLNSMNFDVVLAKGEACCGAPLMGLGLKEDAAELAERNITTFKKMNVEAVIGLCPTCVHFLKNEYRKLAGDGVENAVEASRFFAGRLHAAGAGSKSGNGNPGFPGSSRPLKVAYHEPCHSAYSLNAAAEPGHIIKSAGYELMDTEPGCCGFGGPFRLLYRNLSGGILQKRIEEYKKADMIVTSCPNCIIQLRGKIRDKKIRHIIEIIEEALQDEEDKKEKSKRQR